MSRTLRCHKNVGGDITKRPIETTSATTIAALAFALIGLGALYWLMGEKDKKGGAVRQQP
jgi:hypothetical protein